MESQYGNGKSVRVSIGPRTTGHGNTYIRANAVKGAGVVAITVASRWDFGVLFLDTDEAVTLANEILSEADVYTLTDKGRAAVR
jgi:hypothetical protein